MNILVTGGTSGLGKCIVEQCASLAGNTVYFTYAHNATAAKEIEDNYDNAKAFHVDFTDDATVDAFIDTLPQLSIDVLVNNAYAGTPQGTYFHKTDATEFRNAFLLNAMPLIRITQTCLLGMRKRKFGKIISIISSYVIDVPPMGFSVYAATKAYIMQLSKSWAKENARFNITANCVLPSFMHTALAQVEDFQLEQLASENPLKRILEPSEVASVVMSLISASQQVNGIALPINAAQHIM